LGGNNFVAVNLAGQILANTNFSGATLTNANLTQGQTSQNANLYEATLNGREPDRGGSASGKLPS